MHLFRILALLTLCSVAMMTSQVKINFEEYTLDNGLTVILHEDHSAPVAAVTVMYHVGSKNEVVHRTGFAHLFEHMMFKGSEHVADGEHFKLLQEIGANINGFTTEDGTTYFEVVPSNHVELGLYLESDRMGFLLPAVTQPKLDNQRDVVKNERRQRVDNVPYGTADEKISKAIFPEVHPYSWPVIGYMEDLSAASLEDVHNFFRTYYAPNNAVLVVAGDVTPSDIKPLIAKYFGPIPKGRPFERPKAVPVELPAEKRMSFEDKVQLPRLFITWPGPANYTREHAVMQVFAGLFGQGKTSRLYKALQYDRQVAQNAIAVAQGMEIGGLFQIDATAKPEKGLTEVETIVDSVLQDVLTKGVTADEIAKQITSVEVDLVNGKATNLGKATSLAFYHAYTGDAQNMNKALELYAGITPDEVLSVAKKYLARPAVVLSVVPQGKPELAATKGAGK